MQHYPHQTFFILVNHGHLGVAYEETEPSRSLRDVVECIKAGEYDRVDDVFCADTEEGTWRKVTDQVAIELESLTRDEEYESLVPAVQELLDRHGLRAEPASWGFGEMADAAHDRCVSAELVGV